MSNTVKKDNDAKARGLDNKLKSASGGHVKGLQQKTDEETIRRLLVNNAPRLRPAFQRLPQVCAHDKRALASRALGLFNELTGILDQLDLGE